MVDQELLNLLVCPETKQDLEPAGPELIAKINLQIEQGILINRGGEKVAQKIDQGLVQKQDRKYLYPIRDDIPIMLIEEAIAIDGLA